MSTAQTSLGRTRGVAVLIVSILLILGAVVYIGVARSTSSGSDFNGDGNGVEKIVEIPEGSNLTALGPTLEELGVVRSNRAFQTAVMANPDADNIKPGFYRLQEKMSAKSAVAALLDPATQVEMLKIPGGQTLNDVRVVGGDVRFGIFSSIARVTCGEDGKAEGCIHVDELKEVAAQADASELGVPEWALGQVGARVGDPKRLEGLIAPGEYVVDPHADAKAILTDLITRSTNTYNATDIVGRAKAIGLSPYELLIAASLVEREAPAGEFEKVARVILNRLDSSMRLEFDSTVNYGLESVEVATGDSDRHRETPWNTYAKDGLPDTPIASPSEEAIRAMENPAEGDWLFFVTIDKDGTTLFTNTFDEHQEAVQRAYESGILDSQR
ncbi:endolytic transglycosylase MltG [Corynebacterium tuscaniense]|uniref:endolytic transglycosylase MltG n=1 Tax=Corynebacterium tuscaniense TaxID=302449 RepID=UPI00123A97D6|nr:endolytic transglycosylase MltG [Corynebacterium tuscaniense]KAA8745014.1 endolytic transglycosylase MltG [Corynebacterium tuscaniense]